MLQVSDFGQCVVCSLSAVRSAGRIALISHFQEPLCCKSRISTTSHQASCLAELELVDQGRTARYSQFQRLVVWKLF